VANYCRVHQYDYYFNLSAIDNHDARVKARVIGLYSKNCMNY